MDEYQKVDSDSVYFRLARADFRSAAPLAMKAAGERCLAWIRAAQERGRR